MEGWTSHNYLCWSSEKLYPSADWLLQCIGGASAEADIAVSEIGNLYLFLYSISSQHL